MTAQRLPVPGQDDGTWGVILNAFMAVEHNIDGTLKIRTDGSVPLLSNGKIDTANLGSGPADGTHFLRGDGIWALPNGSGASAATTTDPGLIQLAGDLGGTNTTASVPIIANGAISTAKLATGAVTTAKLATGAVTSNEIADGSITNADIAAGAAIARAKLDGSTQISLSKADSALQSAPVTSVNAQTGAVTLTKSDVGLSNVDNTSDTTKNSATATLTNKTISGVNNTLNNIPESAITNLTTDLASKAAITSLATVATSGNYTDLTNKPTIPTLDTTASDIQPLGTQAAGAIGKAADAGHVHAMPRLDQLQSPTASVAMNAQKITGLANGIAPSDAATVSQIPIAGVGSTNYAAGNDTRITGALKATNNLSDLSSAATARTNLGLSAGATMSTTAGGDLSGTLPNPTVTKINGVTISGTPSLNKTLVVTDVAVATWTAPTKTMQIKCMDDSTVLTTGTSKVIIAVSVDLNGFTLTSAHAYVTTASTSGLPAIQIRNITNGNANMLTTAITIDVNEMTSYSAATTAVVDTTHQTVATGDLLAIDVNAAGAGAKGLGVILQFTGA